MLVFPEIRRDNFKRKYSAIHAKDMKLIKVLKQNYSGIEYCLLAWIYYEARRRNVTNIIRCWINPPLFFQIESLTFDLERDSLTNSRVLMIISDILLFNKQRLKINPKRNKIKNYF